MIFAVILAGGRGERFWPLSRELEPKQFLNVTGELSLIQNTAKRVKKIVPSSNIYVVTNRLYAREIRAHLSPLKIKPAGILLEPSSKNTAPAIAWVSQIVYSKDKEAILAIFPSDHFIRNEASFIKILKRALRIARDNFIVTLGIRPNMIHEGYGYIRIKKTFGDQRREFYRVEKFIEKPNPSQIKRFMKQKLEAYFWNSGIFISKASVLLEEFRKYSPRIYNNIKNINPINLHFAWARLPSKSLDCAVMERTECAVMLDASNIGWSDVGSWSALCDFSLKDKNKNIIRADSIDIGSRNIVAWGKDRLIATVGLKDTIIIDTNDALLVCDINQTQKVKDIVKTIKQRKRSEHIYQRKVKFLE